MQKLGIIALMTTVLLASCGGGKANDALARNCEVERTTVDTFSLCLPDGWVVASQAFGEQGSLVIYVTDDANNQLMQVHVKKDPLKEPVVSTMAFAERAVAMARDTAPNYEPYRTDPITVDTKETVLHVFSASPDPEEDPVRYYQFVTTHGGIAYGFTAVMNPQITDEQQNVLQDIFTNVQFI